MPNLRSFSEGRVAALIAVLAIMSSYLGVAVSIVHSGFSGLGIFLRLVGACGSLLLLFIPCARRVPRLASLLVIFLFLFLIRVISDAGFGARLERLPAEEYLFWSILGILLPFLAVLSARSFDLDFFAKLMFVSSFVVVVVFSFHLYSQFGFSLQQTYREVLVDDRSANPLVFGYGGVICFVIFALQFLSYKRVLSLSVTLGLVCLSVYVVIMSGSRGPLLVIFIVLLLLAYWFKRMTYFYFIVPALLGASVLFVDFNNIGAFQRFFSTQDRLEGGREARAGHLEDVVYLTFENPLNMLLGYGIELPGGHWPHNLFLDSLLYFGIFGALLFLALALILTIIIVRAPRLERSTMLVCCLAATHLLMGQFSSSLVYNTGFWILAAVIFSHVWRRHRRVRDNPVANLEIKWVRQDRVF